MNKETFAKKVLSKLRVYDRGALDPVDQENVNDAYTALKAQYEGDKIANWLDGDEIPDNVAMPMIILTAFYLAPDYGNSVDLSGLAGEAKKDLRRQSVEFFAADTTSGEYF